ncbi:MAG: glycosyltransferase family 2 protein [Candidatus Zixiibacteriota bacterium]|nr:MAG: glycosyltransferase family 2 protein [candidate division Zixibacteria bacterium]
MIARHEISPDAAQDLEVSVVMPCLNEEVTVGTCVSKAVDTMKRLGIRGEVVISDNGSTDRSVEIAESLGARVVHQPAKGYGNAYLKGFMEARGRYIIMADSDDSYDLTDLERFIVALRNGADLVMGSRFKGEIKPGAMPPLHRFLGNPVLTRILNLLYGTRISDAHSGMRAFTKDAFERMHLRTEGMEFASEMVIKAAKARLKIAEIPITLYPDGRSRKPHLRSWSDGWRHLRFMLMYDPRHLFSFPGVALQFLGLLLLILFMTNSAGLLVGMLGGLAALGGWAAQRFGFYARTHQFTDEFPDWDLPLQRFFQTFSLEKSLIRGVLRTLLGALLLGSAFVLDPAYFERLVLVGALALMYGLLTIFDAFLTRILQFVGLK